MTSPSSVTKANDNTDVKAKLPFFAHIPREQASCEGD